MLKREFNDMLDNMSYEEQKEALRLLQEDTQSYDDSCNAIEILVEAVVNCIGAIGRLIFKSDK